MSAKARATILGLFFLSGACTLIYQVVWARMLIVVFGVSIYAVSTVLTSFMAGLALGSFYFGRVVDRGGRNGLLLYAILELGIGLFALVFPSIQSGLDEVYTGLYQLLEGSPLLFLVSRFAITFAVLIVPTTLMGATLPVLSKYAVERIDRVGWDVGKLYAVNTFGAAAGSCIAAFLLIEAIGVDATIYLAAAINLLIAAVAWALARGGSLARRRAGGREEAVPATGEAAAGEAARDGHLRLLVLVAFGLSGFVALGYEVVWTRLLSMVLMSATAQTLSTILISFLFGLAAGGAVGARLADRWRDLLLVFAVVELTLGLFGLISVYALGAVPLLWTGAVKTSWIGNLARLFGAAFVVMCIPTFLMGVLFPVVGRLYVTRLRDLGSRIGDIYGINTLGAIFGAFAAGFVFIPAIGTQRSVDLLAWLNILIGAGLLLANGAVRARAKAYTMASFGAAVIALTAILPADKVKHLLAWADPSGAIVHFDEDAGGTVSVHDYGGGRHVLKVNGGSEVPTTMTALQTFRLLGTLPMVLHDKPEDTLVIAFGGGITLASVELQKPRRIDCVEVVPAVIEAAEYFERYNNRIFERFDEPHLNIIIDDGRNHVLRTDRHYDVIISDATHPGTADSWVLYTEEFYRLCRAKLQPGGLVAQWLPLHGLTVYDFKMILRTFRQVYPHATLWLTDVYTLMLGTTERMQIDYEQVQRRLQAPMVRRSLENVLLAGAPGFLSTLALDETALGQYTGDGPTNTDDRPYISFSDRTRKGTSFGVPALASLLPFLTESVSDYLTEPDEATVARLDRRFRARHHYLHGVVAFLEKNEATATAQLQRALRIDPDEANAARLLRRLRPRPRPVNPSP